MRKLLIAIMALVMAFGLAACGGGAEEEAITVPDEIKAVRADVEGIIGDFAEEITADGWGDDYAALLASGEARDYEGYAALEKVLSDYRVESGATYIYALTPCVDGEIVYDVEAVDEVPFAITVDGCEDPDDWGLEYEWEIQFSEAWAGSVASARSAWDDSEEGDGSYLCWSAFAPVYDSEGNIVCIVGVDYPVTEELADFPEWNRDADEWCGYEGE